MAASRKSPRIIQITDITETDFGAVVVMLHESAIGIRETKDTVRLPLDHLEDARADLLEAVDQGGEVRAA